VVLPDSSGPGRLAGVAGYQGVIARYSPTYGISIEKLQTSRDARLYFYLARYRHAVGLSWNRLDEQMFEDDAAAPLGIQHALTLDPMPIEETSRQRLQ
jgi:hypothetical protein